MYLFIHLSTCQSIYLSVCLSVPVDLSLPAPPHSLLPRFSPLSATIFWVGFMIAASAEMGHRFTALPAVMSTITSSPPWQIHMYLSLCSEHVPNLIDSGATPAVWTSCFASENRKKGEN